MLTQCFNDAISDIADLRVDKTGSMLSNWFDVLQKVMDMWESNA